MTIDATWSSVPGSDDFNTASNWTPAAVPDGTGFFGTSNLTNLSISVGTFVNGLTTNPGSNNFSFTVLDGKFLDFTGAGIAVNGGSITLVNNDNFTPGDAQGLFFINSSTAGTASIANNGALTFADTSNAGSANVTNNDTTIFLGSSTAGSAVFTNAHDISFLQTSSAGNATILNIVGALRVAFFDHSSAGSAHITNNVNNNGTTALGLQFQNASTAANAIITNSGEIDFFNTSKAGSASIKTLSGGKVFFVDASSGGHARLITAAGGSVDFSFDTGHLNNHKISVGSIAGAGTYKLGRDQLTVGSNNHSTTVSGAIIDGGNNGGIHASLVKTGMGTLKLSHHNTYTGGTILKAGALDLAAVHAAGTKAISFSANKQVLKIENAALSHHALTNAIKTFGSSDVIDLTGLHFVHGATAIFNPHNHLLTVKSGQAVDHLTLFSPQTHIFKAVSDGHGGTKVVLAPPHANTVAQSSAAKPSADHHAAEAASTLIGLSPHHDSFSFQGLAELGPRSGSLSVDQDSGHDAIKAGRHGDEGHHAIAEAPHHGPHDNGRADAHVVHSFFELTAGDFIL
jgi:autotransporter-associated beta strand protein